MYPVHPYLDTKYLNHFTYPTNEFHSNRSLSIPCCCIRDQEIQVESLAGIHNYFSSFTAVFAITGFLKHNLSATKSNAELLSLLQIAWTATSI